MQQLDPLILTAAFDQPSAAAFQTLRDRYFPPDRNIVPAHLTLFHKLPGAEMRAVLADIRAASATQAPFGFTTTAPRFLGRGCALPILAEPLKALRTVLTRHWGAWLTSQDRQSFQPHVTVQNKVAPDQARAVCAELAGVVVAGDIVGLDLWAYRGGPWEPMTHVPFGTGSTGRR